MNSYIHPECGIGDDHYEQVLGQFGIPMFDRFERAVAYQGMGRGRADDIRRGVCLDILSSLDPEDSSDKMTAQYIRSVYAYELGLQHERSP